MNDRIKVIVPSELEAFKVRAIQKVWEIWQSPSDDYKPVDPNHLTYQTCDTDVKQGVIRLSFIHKLHCPEYSYHLVIFFHRAGGISPQGGVEVEFYIHNLILQDDGDWFHFGPGDPRWK